MRLTQQQLRRIIKEELGAVTQIRGRDGDKQRSKTAPMGDYNSHIESEHAKLRDEIINLRPGWSVGKLEAVTWSHGGGPGRSEPGLNDILMAIKKFDELERKFS